MRLLPKGPDSSTSYMTAAVSMPRMLLRINCNSFWVAILVACLRSSLSAQKLLVATTFSRYLPKVGGNAPASASAPM